jgi:hypothetical protein
VHFITQDISKKLLSIEVEWNLNQCQHIYLVAFVGINELDKLNILENIVNQSNDKLGKGKRYH